MKSVFIKEQKRYTLSQLAELLELTPSNKVSVIRRLKAHGILKNVRASQVQLSMTDLIDDDIEITDVEYDDNLQFYYVFTFVGTIIVNGILLKLFPKYLPDNFSSDEDFKDILSVIQLYSEKKEQSVFLFCDSFKDNSFNSLAILLFLMRDYIDNGCYSNCIDSTEINGAGEISWNKTVNDNYALIINNQPYYTELVTRKNTIDENDFFRRLHACIISLASSELENSSLSLLYNIPLISISDNELDDFGDINYIQYKIENELNTQFNSHKQLVLKAMYSFIVHEKIFTSDDEFSLIGTTSFNLVWEDVCASTLNNQLEVPLQEIKTPTGLLPQYKKYETLQDIISKPLWKIDNSVCKTRTLIPDIIAVFSRNEKSYFCIIDAKYYCIKKDENGLLSGMPGVESVTKQYLYQLAFQQFIVDNKIDYTLNCFFIPSCEPEIKNIGNVTMDMFGIVQLQKALDKILVYKLPAKQLYSSYLKSEKFILCQDSLIDLS